MDFARTLLDALRLTVLRRPSTGWRRIGPGQFWLAALLLLAVNLGEAWLSVPGPRVFDSDGLRGLSFFILLALLVAWAACIVLQRPALFWSLATLVLLIETLVGTVVLLLDNTLLDALWPQRDPDTDHTALLLWLAWTLLAVRRLFDHLEPHRPWPQRSVAAIVLTAAITLPAWFIDRGSFFYPADWDTPFDAGEAPPPPMFEPEDVMAEQHARVDAALAALAEQQPGTVDLYLVAFAGDGSQRVFRNEALYARTLFEQRFGAAGRTLLLINDPQLAVRMPLATRGNLGRVLGRLSSIMDPAEDVLLLFVTSHGSENHELLVALDPLPLAQIEPDWLSSALRGSGIQNRMVVLSACYSGGFLPALAEPGNLVIAAARKDRASFGCGPDSDITFFGRAWLAEALNADTDLLRAFDTAREAIARREQAAGYTPSEPQLLPEPGVQAALQRWRGGLSAGDAVSFDPEALAGEALR